MTGAKGKRESDGGSSGESFTTRYGLGSVGGSAGGIAGSGSLWRKILTLLALVLIFLAIKAFYDTTRTPAVERITVRLASMEPQADPVTLAFISDVHVAGPDMPPSRLTDIVEQINALEPDMLLIAGDFVSDKPAATRIYSAAEAIAPFANLDPKIASVAVPGNHDHWSDMPAIAAALNAQGFTLLANEAQEIGELAIAGLDDDFSGLANVQGTLAQIADPASPKVMLSHSPDPFPDLPENFGLMLAGHTHCGQIALPKLWGFGGRAIMTASRHGQRYACGVVSENGNVLITSAGLGTSILPVRLFTQPEIWLITIRPPDPN